jgi:hypothetical protein
VDQDRHPYRAKKLNPDGTAISFFPNLLDASTNRQDLPTSLFFDHSIWVIRAKHFFLQDGEAPWKEMGPKVKVVLTEGSFDIHSSSDIVLTENWLLEHAVSPPNF